ncbi:ABC transporter permease subunit [Oceanicella actignis]|uniref:Putrescine transport system permease protein n=1 Tax=Oceanicella actignis TaxID=1189325 RepID=A0A1M7S1A3_9RHOB|nr:ABC transporter permease subunit [Oceanicella actignis]SES92740.1 putrescine transport system permease protein [Oceanicella actignis]SHN52134.1 putrescine transport system permease protein [Oceanicella actignis]
MKRRGWVVPTGAALGFAMLYAPIVIMMIYSFNASKLASVWGGWSTRWYGELMANDQVLEAAWISVKVGVMAATVGTVFGTMIAYALSRFGRFRGRLLLAGMATAPIVMPEVVTGLSLLLLFIIMETNFGWPAGRGVDTIVIAHATFCMAFVAVIVQARMADMDESVEEAAMDLGARQPWVFFDVTLPALAPALVSGWLLSFTLSFDDLVIASFVSGPGASTLPMVVFSKVRLGVSPEINALATLMIVAVAAILAATMLRGGLTPAARRAPRDEG